jgi:hypothetical protein
MMTICRHSKRTTPRQDEQGSYQRCLDCGARLPWSWGDSLELAPPRMTQPMKSKAVVELEP